MPLDQPRTDAAVALSRAETCLMKSEECRTGYLRDAFLRDASGHLRDAGRDDLADRLDDDPWGGESGAVLAEVRVLRAARVCPVFCAITGAK